MLTSMLTGILLVSVSQCRKCVCTCDIGSHGDNGADSVWREMRGVLLFTERVGLTSNSLDCFIDGTSLVQCNTHLV